MRVCPVVCGVYVLCVQAYDVHVYVYMPRAFFKGPKMEVQRMKKKSTITRKLELKGPMICSMAMLQR